jgi:hypothetical protein
MVPPHSIWGHQGPLIGSRSGQIDEAEEMDQRALAEFEDKLGSDGTYTSSDVR